MIKMEALKSALEAIGFHNVQTYIQSGNVFVDTDEQSGAAVGFKIKQEILKFGHEVPVVVVTQGDLERCFQENPYLKRKKLILKSYTLHFVYKLCRENNLKISQFTVDEASIDGNKIFYKICHWSW
jgi:uncharacterized protein (DUF1697 family)